MYAILWSIWRKRNKRIFKSTSSLVEELIFKITITVAEWALVRKEFSNFSLNDVFVNWEAYMGCGPTKERMSILWSLPPLDMLKFNVDGDARCKPGPASIGGVLRNSNGDVLFMFSKNVGICDSNEADVLAILEALYYFKRYFHGALILESGPSNAIAWVSNRKINPWKLQFLFNEIRVLSASFSVVFRHELRSANSFANALAKQGVERVSPWEGVIM